MPLSPQRMEELKAWHQSQPIDAFNGPPPAQGEGDMLAGDVPTSGLTPERKAELMAWHSTQQEQNQAPTPINPANVRGPNGQPAYLGTNSEGDTDYLYDPNERGLLSDIGGDLKKRWQEGQQAASEYNQGKITLPEMALASTGKVVAGSANDVAGRVMGAMVPDKVKQGMASGAQSVAKELDETSYGQKLGNVLMGGRDAYRGFMKENPRTARSLESAGNIASFLPMAMGAQSAVKGGQKAIKAAAPYVNKIEAASRKLPGILGNTKSGSIKPAAIDSDMVRRAGRGAYETVEKSGTVFSPSVTDRAINVIEKAKQKPLFNGKVLTKEQMEINAALEDYTAARGQPMTIRDLQGLDSTLGDKAAQAYVSGKANQGRIIANVQDEIRDLVQPGKLSAKEIMGDPRGAEVLMNDAIPLWSTQAKMQDIEKIIERANAMDNPSTAMKTGFRNLMINKKKMATYPKDVQKLIVKAAHGGATDDLLGVLGSRLNQIAGMSFGGPKGAIASTAVATTGRGLRNALKNRQAGKVIDSLVEPVRPQVEKYNKAFGLGGQ